MFCISINHKNAGADVRSSFAFSKERRREIRAELSEKGLEQTVLVCTCNRTELYFTGEDRCCTDIAAETLAAASDHQLEDIAVYLRIYYGTKAVRHLYRVACGIDSMIVGEDEILRQIKEAYAEAHEGGFTGYELNTIFQSAIACAKRIKTETPISRTPVSTATIAAKEAVSQSDSPTVMLIGASGKIGTAILRDLLSHKSAKVIYTVRSRMPDPAHYTGGTAIPYSERYQYMDMCDSIISATSSPHFTVTNRELSAALKTEKPRVIIDLAVPPDAEKSISSMPGIRLVDIDQIGDLAKKNDAIRMSSAERAEEIISEEISELEKRLAYRSFMPKLERIRPKLDRMDTDQLIFSLRENLDSGEFKAVLSALEKIGAK